MNLNIDKYIGILNASDIESEATYNLLPPLLQRYVDTGDVLFLKAHHINKQGHFNNDAWELAVFATNAIATLAKAN